MSEGEMNPIDGYLHYPKGKIPREHKRMRYDSKGKLRKRKTVAKLRKKKRRSKTWPV